MNASVLRRWLERLVVVRPEEVRALAWSFAYFFCLLAGYYVLRPLRDEMGIAGGVRNLQWLFTATFLVMLAAVPVFGAVVARLPRRRFVPLVYHTKRLAFASGLRQCCTDIIRFSHGASSGRKIYRSAFIPGLHDVCMVFEKTR